jgi:4-aminobutyrate aminotransferase-like enzyme
MAVLQVMDDERLMENAAPVSAHALGAMRKLSHPLIHDVRGVGLFFGIELARGGEPAIEAARHVVERMRERGVLMGRVGRAQHILKLRPPMPFSRENADLAVGHLAEVLAEMPG